MLLDDNSIILQSINYIRIEILTNPTLLAATTLNENYITSCSVMDQKVDITIWKS